MAPINPQIKITGQDIGMILAKLEQHDAMLRELKDQNECILEGMNGTPQHIGLAGEVRTLISWREALEKEEPLTLQIKDLIDWQRGINRVLLFVGTPLFGVVLIGTLAFLWGLLTHSIEIMIH